MKVLGILGFVLYVMHCGLCAKSNGVLLRFVSVSCSSSNKTCVDWLCFVRPFSRTVTTLNIRTTFLRPMYQVYADVALDYKYGTIYREVCCCAIIELNNELKMYLQLGN